MRAASGLTLICIAALLAGCPHSQPATPAAGQATPQSRPTPPAAAQSPQQVYDETYYAVLAGAGMASIVANEYFVVAAHKRLGTLDELLKLPSAPALDKNHVDKHGIRYELTLAPDGKSMVIDASREGLVWTRSYLLRGAKIEAQGEVARKK